MKKNVLLLFVMAAIAISGCKKDDKIDDDVAGNIVGKWYLKKVIEKVYENGKIDDSSTDLDEDFTDDDYFEMKADGKGVQSMSNGSNDPYMMPFTYKVEGKNLILTIITETETFTITKLSGKDLELYQESSEVEGGITYKETEEYTFKKK